MKDEKQVDSRIKQINVTSLGWVYVFDADGEVITELCGAWTSRFAVDLEKIAPEDTKFNHWRELPFSDRLFLEKQ